MEIDKTLKASHGLMSVSKTHPNWVAYVDFVNGIVVRGLSKLVLFSLQHLAQQLDAAYIKKHGIQPMLVLKLKVDDDAALIEANADRRASAARADPLAAMLRVATPGEVEELVKKEASGEAGMPGYGAGGGDEEDRPDVRRVPLVRFDPDVLEEEEMDEEKQLQRALLKAAGMMPREGEAGAADGEGEEERKRATIWSIVNGWVESFYQAAAQVKRLDDSDGKYVREMMGDVEVQMLLARINEQLRKTEEDTGSLRADYEKLRWVWEQDPNEAFERFRKEAVVVIDVSEEGGKGADGAGEGKEDGDEGDGEQEEAAQGVQTRLELPDLDKYDDALTELHAMQGKVARMPSPLDLGWVRINTEPAKLAIAQALSRWSNVFASHLEQLVVDQLRELRDFMASVNEGLAIEVSPEQDDKTPLRTVMQHIRSVNVSMEKRKALFEPIKRTLALLKSHGRPVDELVVDEHAKGDEKRVIDYLEEAPIKFSDTTARAFTKKESIFQMQTEETKNVKI